MVQRRVQLQSGARSRDTGRSASDHVIEVDGLDASRINEAMDFSWAQGSRSGSARRPQIEAELVEAMRSARNRLWNDGAFGNGVDTGSARLSNLVGTDIEQKYDKALRKIGIMPGMLSSEIGHA